MSVSFLASRHEYNYAHTEMDIDSGIAVRIFVLDTPAECTLTSLRDVWLREVLKLQRLCVRINLKPLAWSQNFSTLHYRAYGEFLLVSDCAESRICLVSGAFSFDYWKVSRDWYCAFQYVPDEVVQTRIELQHSKYFAQMVSRQWVRRWTQQDY